MLSKIRLIFVIRSDVWSTFTSARTGNRNCQAANDLPCDDSGENEFCSRFTRFNAHSSCVYTKGKYRFKYVYSMSHNTFKLTSELILFYFHLFRLYVMSICMAFKRIFGGRLHQWIKQDAVIPVQ